MSFGLAPDVVAVAIQVVVVFPDHSHGSRVLRAVPAATFAVVIVGVGIEAGTRVVGVAFRSFFFSDFFFGLRRFCGFSSLGFTLFTSLPSPHRDYMGAVTGSTLSSPTLAGALALAAESSSFASLLRPKRPTVLTAFVRSASDSGGSKGHHR